MAEIKLSAQLQKNGLVVTCLSGWSFVSPPSPSEPKDISVLTMMLDNSALSPDQKEEFLKLLKDKGTAEISLPSYASTLVAL